MLVGDWKEIEAAINNASQEIKTGGDELMRKIARLGRGVIVRRLKTGQVPGPELDPDTVDAKLADNEAQEKLVATGKMADSYQVQVLDGGELIVAPIDEENKIKSLVHEYGTDTVPARPFVQVSYDETIRRIPQIIEQEGFKYTGKK